MSTTHTPTIDRAAIEAIIRKAHRERSEAVWQLLHGEWPGSEGPRSGTRKPVANADLPELPAGALALAA